MAGARFADSFWDDDDRGVGIVADKLELSKQTCDEIKQLYEIRAQIEEDYGERLLKLSQMEVGQAEHGTLAESISHIPSAIEITARAHVDLAHQLRQHLHAPLDTFTKDQGEKRKAQSQQVDNSKQLRSMHYANVVRARDHYRAESNKIAGMEKYITDRRQELSPDEVYQVQEEIEEQKNLVATAEIEYKRAVDVLNDVTKKWISDWQGTCDVYQELEESRINFIRSSLWAFANMMSSVYIVDDQCCERIRSALELTDVDKDIKAFIEKNGTGTKVTALMSYEAPLDTSSDSSDRGAPQPPPTASLPPVPTTLPPSPSAATRNSIIESPELQVSSVSNDASPRDNSEPPAKPAARALSDLPTREMTAQQTHGSIPTLSMHHDENKRASSSVASYTQRRESTLDSFHGFEFVEYAQPEGQQQHTKNHDGATEQQQQQQHDQHDHHHQPDTMSFAFKEIESMLDGVGREVDVHSLAIQPNPAKSSTMVAQGSVARSSSPPPFTHNASPASHLPTVPTPTSAPVHVPSSMAVNSTKPTRNDSDVSDKSSNNSNSSSNNLRFKPIPNPTYEGGANGSRPSSRESVPKAAPAAAAAPRAPVVQSMPTPGEDEEESEDDYPQLVRPKPREEKWMISSIRRPQQLPVRSQNARIYDRQSTIPPVAAAAAATAAAIQPAPDLRIDTSMSQPHVPSAAGAAHQALATVRSQLQRHASSPSPNDAPSSSSPPGDYAAGIRAAPWHQQHQRQSMIAQVEPRSDLYTGGGLGRQNSVNGPRPESRQQQHLTPVPGDDYMIASPPFSNFQQQAPSYAPSQQQQQAPSYAPSQQQQQVPSYAPSQQQQQQQFYDAAPPAQHPISPQSKPSHSQSIKEKAGGRFSRALFGKKRGKEEEAAAIPEVPKMPSTTAMAAPQQTEKRPPPQQDARSPPPMRDSRLPDGMPIIGYVRALWSYEAKIDTEMSFAVGDTFAVIHKQPDGWWEAEMLDPARRSRGLIPGNYMEALQS